MNLLAIDTSSERLSLAVMTGGEVNGRTLQAGQRHAELLLDEMAALMGQAGLTLDKLDAVVFGSGPGSFTGLRIACGVAQGLALSRGLCVLPVCSLEALAENAGADQVVCCIDARMGEVYHAAYRRVGPGAWAQVIAPGVHAPGDVPLVDGAGWTGCGNGFALHASSLGARLAENLCATLPEAVHDATAMLRIALPRLQAGGGVDPAVAVPLYVRDRVAQTTRERDAARAAHA